MWGLTALLALWAGVAVAADPERLPRLGALDAGSVTVSGLSSGAFFAHQMHVAHSATISGAGLLAGGPYACAGPPSEPWWIAMHPYGRVVTAVGICTRIGRAGVEAWSGWWGGLPEAPEVADSLRAIGDARAAAVIDDPGNLADDRVWLFSGTRDAVVPAGTAGALATLYRRLGVDGERLAVVDDMPAAHGLPVESFDGDSRFPKRGCGEHAPPYVIDCDVDAAGLLLRHLYPDAVGDAAGAPQRDRLRSFDQRDFFDAGDRSISLADSGFIYVPVACADDGAGCRLHVAFHGCDQGADAVGDDFVWDGGYPRWAEAGGIVVLYPQAVAWTPTLDVTGWSGNPRGCWDWWGYGGDGYADHRGGQMRAVRAMIGRLLGE